MSELDLWNELGNLYYKTGACDEAIRTFQKAIMLDPGSHLPYKNLTDLFVSQGRYAEAIPMLKKRIELRDGTVDQACLWNQLGEVFWKLEDFPHACASYQKAIEISPGEATYLNNLNQARQALRAIVSESLASGGMDNNESCSPALTEPEELTSANTTDISEDEQPGLQPEDNSQDENATQPVIVDNLFPSESSMITALDIEQSTLPDKNPAGGGSVEPSVRGWLRLGILHWRKDELGKAIQFLTNAKELASELGDHFHEALAHCAIARIETDEGKIEQAIQSYQDAAKLAPDRIFPWKYLGDLNCMVDRFSDALTAFQKAVEHDPKDPSSWNGLGDVYHKLGRNEDAIAAYQLGNVFEKHTPEVEALKEYELAIDSEQGSPVIWNEAGNIYLQCGALNDAIACYRQAITLDPGNPDFQTNLAKAERIRNDKSKDKESLDSEPLQAPEPKEFRHTEPFILETSRQEARETNDPIPNQVEVGQIMEVGGVPEKVATSVHGSGGSEHAFWMFKTAAAPVTTPQPENQYRPALSDTDVETIDRLPAFELHLQNTRPYSGSQLHTDMDNTQASQLVQLPPRAERPNSGEASHFLATVPARPSVSLEMDPRRREPSFTIPGNNSPNIHPPASKPEEEPVDQDELDLKVLEHDIAAFRKVTEINPYNDRAWDTLGNMYENIGLHSQAVSAFEQAIALDPHKEVYHYHLGIALGYLMQYNKAIQALQKVIDLNPLFMLAHCALAGYYRRLGREAEAQEHMEIARPSVEQENEYNQACFESIGGNANRAIELLEVALKQCQVQPGLVRSDPDLDFIRKDPRFKALLEKNSRIR
jgi:tetratricopeptide (TPR) repeat protein